MMPHIRVVALAVLSCSGFVCFGQEQRSTVGMVHMKVVKGSPFSAKAVTESTRTLADGNRIVRTSTALIARDSEGRTRREQRYAKGSGDLSVVFIQDPVAGFNYVLEPQSRSARKVAVPNVETSLSFESDPAQEVDRTNTKREPLGTQMIEGVQAEGTRVTKTISAGLAGNERAVEIVLEAWYSAELQTVVMRKTTDPIAADSVYRLTDIKRSEPQHPLFELPPEYAVKEE